MDILLILYEYFFISSLYRLPRGQRDAVITSVRLNEMADLADLQVGCRRHRRVVEAEPWLWAGVCRMMNSWLNSLEVLVLCLYRKW